MEQIVTLREQPVGLRAHYRQHRLGDRGCLFGSELRRAASGGAESGTVRFELSPADYFRARNVEGMELRRRSSSRSSRQLV